MIDHVAVILSLEGTHQASCRCGWEGKRHPRVSGAQEDIREHFEVALMVEEFLAHPAATRASRWA